uniref:Uncharacterized protein n=1 Tax=Arcella intermedia TaxID=1963864 RepID=A0A6B2L239_9EUKA
MNSRCTALILAVDSGNEEVSSLLIEKNAMVAKTQADGCTALHIAAKKGYFNICQKILQSKQQFDVEGKNNEGHSPMHLAVVNGNTSIVELLLKDKSTVKEHLLYLAVKSNHAGTVNLLLENKASCRYKDENEKSILQVAIENKNIDILKSLLEKDKKIVNKTWKSGHTALHYTVQNSYPKEIIKLLVDYNADPSKEIKKEESAFDIASPEIQSILVRAIDLSWLEGGIIHTDVMKKFLERHAPKHFINGKSKNGRTALHWICHHGKTEIVSHLLELKADIKEQDENGETPICLAIKAGHLDLVRYLVKMNYHTTPLYNEKTFLHVAAAEGKEDIVSFLINNGAELNAMDNNGRTPLQYAITAKNNNIVTLLIQKKADITTSDKYGANSLHWAARAGDLGILKHLLTLNSHKQFINQPNIYHFTPLDYANMEKNQEVLNTLQQVGAVAKPPVDKKDERGHPLRLNHAFHGPPQPCHQCNKQTPIYFHCADCAVVKCYECVSLTLGQ